MGIGEWIKPCYSEVEKRNGGLLDRREFGGNRTSSGWASVNEDETLGMPRSHGI